MNLARDLVDARKRRSDALEALHTLSGIADPHADRALERAAFACLVYDSLRAEADRAPAGRDVPRPPLRKRQA